MQWVNHLTGTSSDGKVYSVSLFEEGTVLHSREGSAAEVASSTPAGTLGPLFHTWRLGQEATNRI